MRSSAARLTSFMIFVLLAAAMLAAPGFRVQAQVESEVDTSLKQLNTLLSLVEENHATPVDSRQAVYGAIDGMLRTLDPHSKFFNPTEFESLQEDQRGRYYGLGITVTTRFGKVTIVSPPFPSSPAEKVGLRVGDVISHVDGEPTDVLNLNEVVSRLKGPKGTPVQVTIARPGVEEPIQLSVIRDEIAKNTISNVFHIRPGIGYVKLENFAATTSTELAAALEFLRKDRELDGLVFDLRNNPGGLLSEAITVSETFLQAGQTIVETRGRASGSNRPYTSRRVNTDHLYPLVILINENSASASEIVAGAIQDYDRGLVIGHTSFGKGLVQSVYPLQQGRAGLALTTQKWYTPSGRLIQRDYEHVSQFDYMYHRDAPAEQRPEDIKYSSLGRPLYGGGGIAPDYVVDAFASNDFQELMVNRYAVFTFVRDFLAGNPPVDGSFRVSDAMLEDFKQHIQRRGIEFEESDFQANLDYLKRTIRWEVFYNRLGVAEAARVLLEDDPQLLKAIELMPEARDLQTSARRLVVQQR